MTSTTRTPRNPRYTEYSRRRDMLDYRLEDAVRDGHFDQARRLVDAIDAMDSLDLTANDAITQMDVIEAECD